MLRLTTFGGLVLERKSRPLGDSARQPKPLALLAVIAAAGARGVSREQVALYFWPESTMHSARGTLNQTLYSLRRDLEEPDLFLKGKTLRLNPNVIGCDHWEFEAALGRRELEVAAGIYKGRFLDSMELVGAPEFERWLDTERDRLAQRYFQALVTLASRASDRGEHHQAVEWWRVLTQHDPLSAIPAAGLITDLSAAGDGPAALQFAKKYEAYVRSELGIPVESVITQLISRLEKSVSSNVPLVSAADMSRTLEDMAGFDQIAKPDSTAVMHARLIDIDEEGAQVTQVPPRPHASPGTSLFQEIVECAADGIYCTDAEGAFTYVNATCERMLRLPRASLIGRLYVDFVREDYRHRLVELYMRQIAERVPVTHQEFPIVPAPGKVVWVSQQVQLLETGGGVKGLFAIARDITLRKRLERTQKFLSAHDRNTKLLNAAGFQALVDHRIAVAKRAKVGFLLVLVHVDNMQEVATQQGLRAAEAMAETVAEVLRTTFRISDVIARLRADEFAVLAVQSHSANAGRVLSRLHAQLSTITPQKTPAPEPLISVATSYYDPEFPTSVDGLFSTIKGPNPV